MIVTLDIPDGATCVGLFVNYQTEEQVKTHSSTTTNCLINLLESNGVTIFEDGKLKYHLKTGGEKEWQASTK